MAGAAALMALLAVPVHAQAPETTQAASARWSVGGEFNMSFGSEDPGYFNYADYEHSTLRFFIASLSASVRLSPKASVVAEARSENGHPVRASALFVRLRPWAGHAVDVQAGRIPPIFGRYARRGYGADNPLIGWPLAYQYLVTLRPDAVPLSADSLLAIRGRGWRVVYPAVTSTPPPEYVPAAPDAGVPVVSSYQWDTGVQVHVGEGRLQVAAAVTQGSLSNPLVEDDNGRKQVVGRLTWAPRPAVSLGVSAASGAFLSDAATASLTDGGSARGEQRALGLDAEVSSGYWILRGEVISSWWHLPALATPRLDEALRATSISLEARYRLRPGLYIAARGEHLGFSSIQGTLFGGRPTTWDAPVSRIEAGVGYSLSRRLLLKFSGQYNERDANRPRRVGRFVAAQLSFWF